MEADETEAPAPFVLRCSVILGWRDVTVGGFLLSQRNVLMPQPVKLSDAIVSAARSSAPVANRSIAGQIEHWATLGRAVEGALTSEEVHALKKFNGRGGKRARALVRQKVAQDD